MTVVWKHSRVVAREVLEAVEPQTGWAYTTVKTLMSRLVEKGALTARKRGNTILFEPLITRYQARRTAVRSLIERAFDGTFGSLVQHMIAEEKLSPEDRSTLERMLAESRSDADRQSPERMGAPKPSDVREKDHP